MSNNFLKSKIETGFDAERELLKHEDSESNNLPLLAYVRPILFAVLLSVTLIALGINIFGAISYFIKHS
ncbi:hypothetical protein FPFC_080100 [Fructobacillus pseudoficulneus]|uniref:Uncharacterized protein n=1 Tax=Fructobacillus pseudoficulneus TaxID=220714 RepID=A0A3F3GVW4_9LACO|nr:hypothetical protein [Fructobacillus pseudoficulneus]GAP03435.1 hypothetical protein FPFC_080100 [Fructobacillus pseudoficulneus]SEH46984.1 hypothetical protein SAMN05660469_0010 [Fructobacillus pseudoficulneus]